MQYAEMCQMAEAIQALRGPELWQDGDFYSCTVSGGRPFTAVWTDTEDEPPEMFKPIWLPRQDQLQDMLDLHEYTINISSNGVEFFLVYAAKHTLEAQKIDYQETMEQLWLAFIMKEVYGKVWKDGRWL